LGTTVSFPVFCPITDNGSITFCTMGGTGEDIMIVEPKKYSGNFKDAALILKILNLQISALKS